jgi:hypothetical protein
MLRQMSSLFSARHENNLLIPRGAVGILFIDAVSIRQ